jgi:general secretion pathway protein C
MARSGVHPTVSDQDSGRTVKGDDMAAGHVVHAARQAMRSLMMEDANWAASRATPTAAGDGARFSPSPARRGRTPSRTVRTTVLPAASRRRRPTECTYRGTRASGRKREASSASDGEGELRPRARCQKAPFPMKHRWTYNLLVAGVALSFWVPTIRGIWKAEGVSAEPLLPPAATTDYQGSPVTRPLEDYGIVSERKLFGGSGEESSDVAAEVAPDALPTAGQGLGLRLVGTVVADEPGGSFAIIEGQAGKTQEIYHEGDRAGQALIKRIVRNRVVVNAGRGDEVLAMDLDGRGGIFLAEAPGRDGVVAMAGAAEPAPKQIGSIHAEYADLISKIHVRPYLDEGRPGGILVYGIEPGSVFAEMGLEDGDVIRGLNGEEITSPRQTVDIYRALREGGALTVRVRRGESTQELRFEGKDLGPPPRKTESAAS